MMRVTPITSTADIERAVTQAATDPEAQWYVTRVAKALGAEDLLPGSWQMEADNISSFRDYRSAEMSQEQNLERAGELVEAVVASAMDQVSGEATFDDVVTLAVSAGIQAEMDSLGEEFEEVLAVTLKSLVAGGHIDADTAALITPGVRGAAFVEAIESGEDGEALTAGILKRIKTAEGAIRYDGQIGEPIRPNEDVDAPDAVPTVEDTTARRGVFRRRPKPAPPAGRQQQSSNRVEDYTVTPGPTEPNVPDNAVRVNPDTGESLTNTPSTPRNSAPTTPAGVPEFNERDFNARIDARAAAQEAEKAAKAKPAKPAEPAKAAEQPKPAAKPESTGNNEESIPAWLEQSLAREFEYRSQQGFGGPDNFEDYKAQQLKKIKEEEAARAQPSTENLRDRVAERKAAKETTKAEPEKADEAPKADEAAKPKKDTKPKKDAEAKSDPDQPSESTRNAEEVAAEEAARIAAEDPEGVSLAQGQSISLADAARAARERKQALADRAASAARTNKIDTSRPAKRQKKTESAPADEPKAEKADKPSPAGPNKSLSEVEKNAKEEGGVVLFHGGLPEGATLDDVDLNRQGSQQAKRNRDFGGFYLTDDSSRDWSDNYAQDRNGAVHGFRIKPDARIHDMGGNGGASGNIDRIKAADRAELAKKYDVIKGKDLMGRTQYLLLNKDAVAEVGETNIGTKDGKKEPEAPKAEAPKADAPEATPEAPKSEAPKAKPAKKAAPARRAPAITEPAPAAAPRNGKPFVVKETSTASGKTRYMVQNVGKTVGLEVEWGPEDYSGKREITSGKLNGKAISLSDARAIHNARVWYDENDKVHVDRYAGESSLSKDDLLKAIEESRGAKSARNSVETIQVTDATNNLNRNPRFRPRPTSIDAAAREAQVQAARDAVEAARNRVDSPTQRRDDSAEQRVVDNAVQQENNGNRRIVLTEENPTVVLTGPNAGQPARTPDRTGNEPVAPPSTPPGVDPDSRPTDGTPSRRPNRIPGGRTVDQTTPYNFADNEPEMEIRTPDSTNDSTSPDFDPGPISEDDPFRNPDTENLAEPDRPADDPFAPENNPNYTPGPYRWDEPTASTSDDDESDATDSEDNDVADVQDDTDVAAEERNTAEAKAAREARIAKVRNQFYGAARGTGGGSKKKKGKTSLIDAVKTVGVGFMTGFLASGRFVDTPEGEQWYDAPIGTPIRKKPKVLGKLEHAIKGVSKEIDKDSIHTDDIRGGHAGVHPANIKVGAKLHNANGSFTVTGHDTPETDSKLNKGEHRVRVTRDSDGADRAIKFYPEEGWNTPEHQAGTAKPSGSRHLQTLDKSDPKAIKPGERFHDREGSYEAVAYEDTDSPVADGEDAGAYTLRVRKIGDSEGRVRDVTFAGGITSGDPAEAHNGERSAHVEESKVDKSSSVRTESARVPSAVKPKTAINPPGTASNQAPATVEKTDAPTPSAKTDIKPTPEQFKRVSDTLNRVSQGNTKYDGGYRAKEVAKLSREDRDLMLKMINDNKTFENYRARKNGQLAPSLILQERTQLSIKASLERLNDIEDGKVKPGPAEPLPSSMVKAAEAAPEAKADAPKADAPEKVRSEGFYTEAEMRKAGEEAIATDPVAARAYYEQVKEQVRAGKASAKDMSDAWKNYMAVRDGKPGTLTPNAKSEKVTEPAETPKTEAPKVETPAAEAPEAAAPAEVKIAEPADEYSALAMETRKSWLDHGFYSLVHRVRETAQRYQREGYEGPGEIANKNLELMKMSRSMGAAGREKKMQFADLMAGQIVSEAHASEPSPKDFYRGIQLVEEDVQKLRDAVGGQVSLPLSSFTPNAERAREFADDPAIASSTVYKPDEGKPVLIYVSRGAKTATMSDSGRDEESVIFGTFTIDAVTEKDGRTEVDLTQVSLVETPSDDPFRISVRAPGAKTETITPTADEDAPNPDATPDASPEAPTTPKAKPEVDVEDKNAKKVTLQLIQARNEANRAYTKAMMEAAIKKTPEAIAKREDAKAALDAADAAVVNDQVGTARTRNMQADGVKPAIAAKPRPSTETAAPKRATPEDGAPEARPESTEPVTNPADPGTLTGTKPAKDGSTISPADSGVTFIKDKMETYGVVNYNAKGKDPERFTPKTSLADGTKPEAGTRVVGLDGRTGTVTETYQTHSGITWDDGTKKSITNKKLNAVREDSAASSGVSAPAAAATPPAPFKPQPMNTNPQFVKDLSDEDLDAQHQSALTRARVTRGSNARSADYADAKAAADTARIEKEKRAAARAAAQTAK